MHAEIVGTDVAYYLHDLASTNGTYLNGQRLHDTALLHEGDLVQFADMEFHVTCVGVDTTPPTLMQSSLHQVWPFTQFQRLLHEPGVIPFFQPIVTLANQQIAAYEVLARSTVPGLESPDAMFTLARRLQREIPLSILCRQQGVLVGQRLPGAPHLFLNSHPAEALLSDLLNSLQALRQTAPTQQITLEIHESAVTDRALMKTFTTALRSLDMGLAYDDFGAGQSRLLDLVDVPPDYLKFDRSLIQDLHLIPAKQQMVEGLLRIVREYGVATIAEGIE
jgi:EAL domain-containing protein (putative c-di-GMP-specific phosphodiesterase class I)